MNTSLGTGPLQLQTVIPPLPNPPIPTLAHRGTPRRWENIRDRGQYLQNRVGHYLEIHPNGTIKGNLGEKTMYGIIMLISYVTNSTHGQKPKDTIAIKGVVSNLFLCMDNRSHIYASRNVTPDCAFSEGFIHNYNVYYHASHKEKRKKFYLGIERDGRMKPGLYARNSQSMSQFLPVQVPPQSMYRAKQESARLSRTGIMKLVGRNTKTPDPAKKRKNERRRRRRRWCSKLQKIYKNQEKYQGRCKRFCDLLDEMIKNYSKHKKRCERARKRRRKQSNKRRHRRRHRAKRHDHSKRGRRKEGRRQRTKRKLREYRDRKQQTELRLSLELTTKPLLQTDR
ncbi:hypothetical protein SNE40_016859 [Patella caerulea]|uniref:Fibroblast growth factor n=1 Tax=Patella caerulea TaxID=87958 RepID=A0AAN8J9C4_PATCE